MSPKSKPNAALAPEAWRELRGLPGNVRRAMVVAIDGLIADPRPANSKQLTAEGISAEIRRLRVGHWRIVYVVLEEQPVILAIRRRPPYDYADIRELAERG
jgi:mRNA-degrading endonuclease RelE of RelBE toxin-antitoxin system